MRKSTRLLTVSCINHSTQSKCVEIPAICLKGKWLEELGFERGKKVSVEASDKQLVITLIEEPAILPKKQARSSRKQATSKL